MFKQVYSGLFIGSTILGITGIVQCFKTQGLAQTISLTAGVGGATSALVCVGLGIAYDTKAQDHQKDLDEKIKDLEYANSRKLTGLKLEIESLKSSMKTYESQGIQYLNEISELKTQLNAKAEQYLKALGERDLKIGSLEGIVSERDTRVSDFLEESRGYTTNFFALRYKQIDGLQKALEKARDNPDVADLARQSFDNRLDDIKKLKQELNDAITDIKELNITDFKCVLDYIFAFDNKFLNVKVRWKDAQVKGFKDETLNLEAKLNDSIPKAVAVSRLEASLEEVDAGITDRYEALLLNNNSIHSQLLDLLETRNLLINDLQNENEQLRSVVDKPFAMYGGSIIAENANKVANFYHTLLRGKKLDVLDWEETELGYKLVFSIRRNPGVTLSELTQDGAIEQVAQYTQSLDGHPPQFAIHNHNATVSLNVQKRKAIKKAPPTIDDIFRECGVIRAELFGATLRKYHMDKTGKPTLRVMSATGGGKGIAVKNLVDYYTKNVDGYEIWLSDPQDGSEEDFWDCEKAATDPGTASILFNRFANLLRSRDAKTATDPTTPILGIFDEFDKKHPLEDKATASQIWTTIRHHSMRMILIGQSGEVGKNRWTWDEMTNCCLLFITDAIPTFIKHADKDLQMNSAKLDKFEKAYDKAKAYIDEVNQEIDPENQYRLAALYCNGQALLLEIPPAHKGVLSDGKSWLAVTPFEKVKREKEESAKVTIVRDTQLSCPHCGSFNLRKRSKRANGEQLYDCKDCSTSPKQFIPNINYKNIEE